MVTLLIIELVIISALGQIIVYLYEEIERLHNGKRKRKRTKKNIIDI